MSEHRPSPNGGCVTRCEACAEERRDVRRRLKRAQRQGWPEPYPHVRRLDMNGDPVA